MALTKVLTGGIALDAVDNTILKLDDDYALTGDNSGVGGMELLLSPSAATGVAAIDISSTYINSTYDNYYLVGYFEGDADTRYLQARVFVGGTVQTGDIYGGGSAAIDGADYENNNTSSHLFLASNTGMGGADGEGTHVSIVFQNANSTQAPFSCTGVSTIHNNSAAHTGATFGGSLLPANRANIVNGIRLKMHAGNIGYGIFKLYGMKN